MKRFQRKEGRRFRGWLKWVRASQNIVAPEIFSGMIPPPSSYDKSGPERPTGYGSLVGKEALVTAAELETFHSEFKE